MSFSALPSELHGMIADAACKIRSNGKASNNLRLIVRTEQLASRSQDEVVRWVRHCLEDKRLDSVRDGLGQYPWKVVSGIVNDIDDVETLTQDGEALDYPNYPEMVVAIHIASNRGPLHHECDNDQLIVLDENPPPPKVDADTFMHITKDVPPPPSVTAVGISAVSDEFMMELWSEIIRPLPNTLDVGGEGYMVHSMWMRMPHGEWITVREQSFNFGWKGYSG